MLNLFKQSEQENRMLVLAEYYSKPDYEGFGGKLMLSPDENQRKILAKQYGINHDILRAMLDYTRYQEANAVATELKKLKIRIKGLQILDFGSLVSDYGIYFARLGAKVTIYDKKSATNFAEFRFKKEHLPVKVVNIHSDYLPLTDGKDLVIFGEVLEHLDDPLAAIEACIKNSVKFVFTSCYPFGDSEYLSSYGHKKSAQILQPACRDLLKQNYKEIILFKTRRLWINYSFHKTNQGKPFS